MIQTKHAGARIPELVEVRVECPATGLTAIILRPEYATPTKGEVRCPHCGQPHAYDRGEEQHDG